MRDDENSEIDKPTFESIVEYVVFCTRMKIANT